MTQLKIEKGCGLSKDWNVSVPVGWNIWWNIFTSYEELCIGHVLLLVRCSSRKAALIFAPWQEELPGAVAMSRNHQQDSTEHTRKPFILRTIGVNSEDIGWSLLKKFLQLAGINLGGCEEKNKQTKKKSVNIGHHQSLWKGALKEDVDSSLLQKFSPGRVVWCSFTQFLAVELALNRQIQHHQDSEDAAATQWIQTTWTETAFVGIISNQNTNNSTSFTKLEHQNHDWTRNHNAKWWSPSTFQSTGAHSRSCLQKNQWAEDICSVGSKLLGQEGGGSSVGSPHIPLLTPKRGFSSSYSSLIAQMHGEMSQCQEFLLLVHRKIFTNSFPRSPL